MRKTFLVLYTMFSSIIFSQTINQTDDDGKRQGTWQFMEEDSLRMQCNFKDDEVRGIIQYFEHGQVVFDIEDPSRNKRRWNLYTPMDTLTGYYIMDAVRITDTTEVDVAEEIKYRIIALYEVYPSYPGGIEAMYKYIDGCSRKTKQHGKVRVQFTIDKMGDVVDVRVKESTNEKLDDLAVKIISEMPNWQPGSDAGKIVSISMVLPLNF